MNLSQITTEKCIWKRKSDFKKSLRSENWDDRNCKKKIMISCGHLSDFFKIGFSLSYTFFSRNLWFPCGKFIDYYVLMHVSFKIHHRNNLIDKKDSYLIQRPPSWDDRNYGYGHQLYPGEGRTVGIVPNSNIKIEERCTIDTSNTQIRDRSLSCSLNKKR
jgi:hypothetical protein